MRYPEARISEVTGITDIKRLALIENYMREVYFYPYKLNSVGFDEFNDAALTCAKELEALSWDFV
jgi:hypothetical protein